MKTFFLVFALVGCTVQTNDNFQNPPPPPPATCGADTTVTGCGAGASGYTCSSDRPDDGDTNLVCSAGRPSAGGTSYCCLPYGQRFSACTTSTTVPGCAEPGFGFSCAGASGPADADSRLACSASLAGSYCCVGAETPGCAADPRVACSGASIGFVCAADPPTGDVACAAVGSGENGATTFCCVPFLGQGCQPSMSAGCSSEMFGFSCGGLHRPEESNPRLACSGSGGSFCCTL